MRARVDLLSPSFTFPPHPHRLSALSQGLGVHAISAIDIALWDLLGKVKGEPVYNLLGGKTMERVPLYATTSRPDLAQQLGFHGAKVPLPWGPEAGSKGMRDNVEFVAGWRAKVGPDFPLMLDCYMALDVQVRHCCSRCCLWLCAHHLLPRLAAALGFAVLTCKLVVCLCTLHIIGLGPACSIRQS